MKRNTGIGLLLALALAGSAMAQIGSFTGTANISSGDGSDAAAGSATWLGGTGYNIVGWGSDWWDSAENGQILYKSITGDFRIEANVTFNQDPVNDWCKAGVFFRNDIDIGDGNRQEVNAVAAFTDPYRPGSAATEQRAAFQYRTTSGGATMGNVEHWGAQPNNGTDRVALQRMTYGSDQVFAAFVDHGGAGWQRMGYQVLNNANNSAYGGLFVTSHDNANSLSVDFSNVTETSPVDYFDSSWLTTARSLTYSPGPGGMGYFDVTEVYNNGGDLNPPAQGLDNLAETISAIDGNAPTRYSYQTGLINIWDTDDGAHGHFTPDNQFYVRSVNGNVEVNQIAVVAEGQVQIDAAGVYSFCVNSDDGFELSIDGKVVMEADYGKGSSDIFGAVNLAAGVHGMRLIYWEGGGGAAVELSAAPGIKSAFDSTFRLVGDASNGGLALVPEPGTTGLFVLFFGAMFLRRRFKS